MSTVPGINNPNIRLDVYHKALEFISAPLLLGDEWWEMDDPIYGLNPTDGLCLVLPCIWSGHKWDNESYDDNIFYIEDSSFTWKETYQYFPEFNEYYQSGRNEKYKCNRTYRQQILQEIITKMESSLKTNQL